MRLNMANSLIGLYLNNPDTQNDFKKLSKHISNNLAPLRNEIVHSRVLYLTEIDAAIRPVYKSRGKVSKTMKPIDLNEYDDVSNQIIDAANQVYNLLGRLNVAEALMHASHNKS